MSRRGRDQTTPTDVDGHRVSFETWETDDGTTVTHIGGLDVVVSLLDSGADDSLVSSGVVGKQAAQGRFVAKRQCAPFPLYPVGGGVVPVSWKIGFDELTLETPAGSLMLRGLVCWIGEEDQTLAWTISRLVMKRLGYSTPNLLAEAKARNDEYVIDVPADVPPKFARMHALMRNKVRNYLKTDAVHELVTTPRLTSYPG